MPVNKKNSAPGAEKFTFSAIGVIESSAQYHYEAPRQAVYAGTGAFLRWHEKIYHDCAVDLTGFARIILLWVFNQNKHDNWHVKVQVPVPAERDMYSVFATRSPYRPNPIGMSVVELRAITPEGLLLGPCDLLDGTAVLDVKPYIPEVDAFIDSAAGWRDHIDRRKYDIVWNAQALEQSDFILERLDLDLQNFCTVQLSFRPTDRRRKRLTPTDAAEQWILHCRTWQIIFELHENISQIEIKEIRSNYSHEDLIAGAADPYKEKETHREFIRYYKD